MDKKGETMLFAIIEMLAAIFIIYILVQGAQGVASKDLYEKARIAKDISLQIDALQGIPGNAYILNTNLSDYNYYFKDGKLNVAKKVENDPLRQIYFYTLGKGDKLEEAVIQPEKLYLSNSDGDIKVTKEEPILLQMKCPVVNTQNQHLNTLRIFLDYDDYGTNNKALANFYEENMKFLGTNPTMMTGDRKAKADTLKASSDYTYISLNYGNEPADYNTIKAYVPLAATYAAQVRNYKMACLMMNAIVSSDNMKGITGTAIIPIEDDLLDAAGKNIAVRLEIGNQNSPEGKELIQNAVSIAIALKDSTVDYYQVIP